jgi:tetratricopeptide (TPR) repeat protein
MGQQALESLKEKLEPDDRLGPDERAIMKNLAFIYLNAGRADKAVAILEQVLAKEKEFFGFIPNSQATSNLAMAYLLAGQPGKAVPLLEQVLANRRAMYAWDHRLIQAPLSNLATAYLLVELSGDNLPVDEDLLRQANLSGKSLPLSGGVEEMIRQGNLSRKRAPIGDGVSDHLSCLLSLAEAYQRSGQASKAESLYRNALETYQQALGNDNLRTALVRSALGSNLLRQHRPGEADPLLRQSLTIRTRKAPDDWITFHTQSLLGGALLGQKKYAEAGPLLIKGYQGMKKQEDKIPPQGKARLVEAVERLVQLDEATGRKDEAAKWRKRLMQAREAPKKPPAVPRATPATESKTASGKP